MFIEVACQEITWVKAQNNDEIKPLLFEEDYKTLKISKCRLCNESIHRILISTKSESLANGYKKLLINSKNVQGDTRELICHLDDKEEGKFVKRRSMEKKTKK